MICQGHLAPVSPIVLPIFWDYDSAMSLYPLPDLVVIGDPSQPFCTTQHECTILNTVWLETYISCRQQQIILLFLGLIHQIEVFIQSVRPVNKVSGRL